MTISKHIVIIVNIINGVTDIIPSGICILPTSYY